MTPVERLAPGAVPGPAARRARPAFLAVAALVALALALVIRRLEPPDPRPAASPPTAFSADRAAAVLDRLLGAGLPHPVGSEENARVRQRVLAELRSLGLEPWVETAEACSRATCATVSNVVARLGPVGGLAPGGASGKAVLLVAHYDSVGAGPGASDDLAGVAALIETARALGAGPPLPRPVILLVDDGEEAGLLGARAFVAASPLAREVGVVVNLEARGTSGPSFLFETSSDNGWMLDAFAGAASRPATSSVFFAIYERLPNDTDLTVFKAAGLSGVNFAFVGGVARYHTPRDDRAHVDLGSLQHQGEQALAAVRGLAAAPQLDATPAERGARSVWFDVLGLAVVRWPAPWSLPASIGTFVALAVLGLRARRRDPLDLSRRVETSAGRALAGVLVLLVAIASGAAGGWLAVEALRRLDALPVGWIAAGRSLVLATWAIAAALALGAGAWLARRAGPTATWFGVWAGLAIGAVALSAAEPAVSYLLLVPSAVAALAGLALLRPGSRPVPALASALPALAVALLAGPFAWLLHEAMGASSLTVVGGLVGLIVAGLLPLAAPAESGARRPPVAVLGALLALGGAAGLAAVAARPAVNPSHPERLTLRFVHDASSGASWMAASPESGRLPEALRAAGFRDDRVPTLPWSRSADGFRAPIPAAPTTGGPSLAAPIAEILEVEPQPAPAAGDPVLAVRLRLRSPRGASMLALGLPPGTRLLEARWGGAALEQAGKPRRDDGGHRFLYGLTVPADGVEVSLRLAHPPGARSLDLLLYDQTPGLPAAAAPLGAARPAWAVESGWGDATLVVRPFALAVAGAAGG